MKTHHRYLLLGAFILLAALVFVPWQARRGAAARHVQQGEAFNTLHSTNCHFIPAASLLSDAVADALRKGMVARQRESEPSAAQVEGLARHVVVFLAFHNGASPPAYPALRLPMAGGVPSHDDLDPGFVEELRHPERVFPLQPEDIRRIRATLPQSGNAVRDDVMLNYALRLHVAAGARGFPCTNCVGQVCLASMKATFVRSPVEKPATADMLLGQPTHGSTLVFRQWDVVKPTLGELVRSEGFVNLAYVTLTTRSGAGVMPLAIVYYWEPGRGDWILCEVGKGNASVAASFIL